jgi:hypothetical protein
MQPDDYHSPFTPWFIVTLMLGLAFWLTVAGVALWFVQ